jgi:GxxExxY protein
MSSDDFVGLHAELTSRIIGVFYAVANELGFGFLESVYRRSMLVALRESGLKVEEEVPIPVWFHGVIVDTFHAVLVVEGAVVLELKTAEEITRPFEAQLLHYLRASEMEVGLVLAFGQRAKFRRLCMTNEVKGSRPTMARSPDPLLSRLDLS